MAMFVKVQSRCQVTIPREIRRAVHIKPGDTVIVRVNGQRKIEIQPHVRVALEDLLAISPFDGAVDYTRDREAWTEKMAQDAIEDGTNE